MRRVTSGRRFFVGLGLEREALSRSRPFQTAGQPGFKVRNCGKVHIDSAANDRGDIEIGHRKVIAE